MKRLFLAGTYLLLFFNVSFLSSQGEKNIEELTTIKVDGFEDEGEWEVHFSRFRSRSWLPENRGYEPDKNWVKWIRADDSKPNHERKQLLPALVYTNPYLKDENTILSVRARWDRQGVNWLSLAPTNRRISKQKMGDLNVKEERYQYDKMTTNYILLPGETHEIRFYIWGMGYNYKLEVHVQDYLGNFYILPAGFLNFYGWKHAIITIPKYVKQISRILPRVRPLKFIQFKVVTPPDELSTGFYAYFDYLYSIADIQDRTIENRLRQGEVYWGEDSGKEEKK